MKFDYNKNLIEENTTLQNLNPFDRLMVYRMLSNEEMVDRDRSQLAYSVYYKLDWLDEDRKSLEPDTFFSSAYYYIKELCKKYDKEQEDNYYIEDFKRFIIFDKKEDYSNMMDYRAQYFRKEWFCLKSTKEHYKKIVTNEDLLFYVERAHKIGAFLPIPKGFGFMPKCRWLLDDGIRALMVIEDNWNHVKKNYGNISFEEYKIKYCLEDAYFNGKLRKELMIDFNMTWDELYLTLRKMAELIDKRTLSILLKLEEYEKNK